MHPIAAHPSSSGPARRHLAAELVALLDELTSHLARLRSRGRSPAGDAVQGLVIEDGEAEGLLVELASRWGDGPHRATRASRPRVELPDAPACFLPIRHADRSFDLNPLEVRMLRLALAVELDSRFARVVAYLNDHVARDRPTLGLAIDLTSDEAPGAEFDAVRIFDRPAIRDGLMELEGDGPLGSLAIRLPRGVLARLVDSSPTDLGSGDVHLERDDAGRLDRLVLDDRPRAAIVAWSDSIRTRGAVTPPLLIAGAPGSGRATLARAAVGRAGLPLVSVDLARDLHPDGLRPARFEVRWHEAALLVRIRPERERGLDGRALWDGLHGLDRPTVLAVDERDVEMVAAVAPVEPWVIVLGEPGVASRARLWRDLLPPAAKLEPEALDGLAARFRFNPGRIARAIRRASVGGGIDPPERRVLTAAQLEAACREVGSAAMGSLAEKLPQPYDRADLVVPERIDAELDLAVAWVTHQRHVMESWGFERRVPTGRGLAALFAGPPGTGKTMAAQVLARTLGLDLYRVDLSRVLSKFIGETEERLRTLFDEAHASGAILFFDEADALFGKRTEVKDAHDRYANVEIGYLLQRMEAYDGVTVLATNRVRDLDEAFLRRFQVVAHFPMPGEADRLRLWSGMLPQLAERAADLNLPALAARFELSGGEIKNIVLASAYLARAAGQPIGMPHLALSLRRELAKNGRIVKEDTLIAWLETPSRESLAHRP